MCDPVREYLEEFGLPYAVLGKSMRPIYVTDAADYVALVSHLIASGVDVRTDGKIALINGAITIRIGDTSHARTQAELRAKEHGAKIAAGKAKALASKKAKALKLSKNLFKL